MDDIQHPVEQPAPRRREGSPGVPGAPAPEEPITIRSAEDILAYVPHALGEWPQESLVAVGLADGRLGPTLRIDLPPRPKGAAVRPATLRRFADTVADYLTHDAGAGAVVAVYTRAAWTAPQTPPHRDVLDAVAARLAEEGVPVLEAWIVGPEHWRTVTCPDTACCPWPGESTAALRTGRIGAEMVYRGSSYGPAGQPEAARPEPPPAAVAAALEAYVEDPGRWWDPLVFTAALAAWDEVLSESRVPAPARVRLLAATLMRPALRDAVLVASAADAGTAWRGTAATRELRSGQAHAAPPALPGGVPAAEAAAALDSWSEGVRAGERGAVDGAGRAAGAEAPGGTPAGASAEFGLILMGSTGAAPAWTRIARLERIALGVAQMEEPELRAPALAVLAWVQWARGRGGRCLAFLERALSTDPGYRLALLLRGLVEQGELAGWARSRDTAWRREAA
ncbi:DUF4192 family protein [Sinomonas atrocyanea]|uniref:DUF4192 family protein n=1 Tax=Sinomonas atrocyanea TaxID=37927 RepID=UPI00278B0123|nr:DUF4192 family protein [Sinomonas atrocyanea]MDQ0260021.1 hypothetical protein [Sinomonas atrocyanea]MDR6620042.1 hypothetical protein [Sinomonas atrocyanea]